MQLIKYEHLACAQAIVIVTNSMFVNPNSSVHLLNNCGNQGSICTKFSNTSSMPVCISNEIKHPSQESGWYWRGLGPGVGDVPTNRTRIFSKYPDDLQIHKGMNVPLKET
ncbi:hypothetical protein Ancab_016686 [Ancistrocladus abbreviatus]